MAKKQKECIPESDFSLTLEQIFKASFKGFWSRVAIVFSIVGGSFGILAVIHVFYPTLSTDLKFLSWVGCTIFFLTVLGTITGFRALKVYYRNNNELREKINQIKSDKDALVSKVEDLEDRLANVVKSRNHRALFELGAYFFGLYKEKHEMNHNLGMDGSMIIRGETKLIAGTDDIRMVENFRSVGHLPPQVEDGIQVEITKYNSNKEDRQVQLEIEGRSKDSLLWKPNFIPALQRGEWVAYEHTEMLPKSSFAMDIDTLEQRKMDWEFLSTRISYPTNLVILRVIFPLDYFPFERTWDVWFGNSKVRNTDEYMRIKTISAFRDSKQPNGQLYLQLEIKYPVQGLHYILKWKPPKSLPSNVSLKEVRH